MNRAYIESAVEQVIVAGEREAFRVVPSIGEPLSRNDLDGLRSGSDVRLPSDYANFLRSANGLRIDFYMRRIPEDVNPAYIFQITGIPETLALTRAWRSEIAEEVREEENSTETVLSERDGELITNLVLINPLPRLLIHPETSLVYTQDNFYMFTEGFLRQVAMSFDDLFQQSFEFMLREGHAKDPW
jgi:hypothetical protein